MNSNTRLLLFALMFGLLMVWYARPIIWSASESNSVVAVFNADERDQVEWVQKAYEEGTYNFELKKYGHLYFSTVLTGLNLTGIFTEVTEQHIILYLRLLSAFFGFLTVILIFQLGRRFVHFDVGWLAAIMMIVAPLNFWDLSFQAHPDIMQVFFIVCALYWTSYIPIQNQSRSFYIATIFAGLACSVKYSGLFLLPVLYIIIIAHQCSLYRVIPSKFESNRFVFKLRMVALFLCAGALAIYYFLTPQLVSNLLLDTPIESERNINFINQLKNIGLATGLALLVLVLFQPFWSYLKANTPFAYNIRSLIFKISGSIVLFVLTFAITSPYLLVDFNFLRGLLQQSEIISKGHVYLEQAGASGWLNVLGSSSLLDPVTLIFSGFGMIMAFGGLLINGFKKKKSMLWIVALWVIIYFLLLILRISHHPPRFLLPIVPPLVVLSAYTISAFVSKILDYITPRQRKSVESTLITIIGVVFIVANTPQLQHYRSNMITRTENNPYLEAGRFLSEQYHDTTRIVYDAYSYIPDTFNNAEEIWNLTDSAVRDKQPEVVVVNAKMSRRFSSKAMANRFAGGPDRYMESYTFYQKIKSGELNYVLVRDFGPVQIYKKKADSLAN